MIERPLMTADELKSMPKGRFVVMKTGAHPMKVKLKLFFDWGITFDEAHPYTVTENANRTVEYADKQELIDRILKKYSQEPDTELLWSGGRAGASGGQSLTESRVHEPEVPQRIERNKDVSASAVRTAPPSRRQLPLPLDPEEPNEPF